MLHIHILLTGYIGFILYSTSIVTASSYQAYETSDENMNSDIFLADFQIFPTLALYKSTGAYQISDFVAVILAIFRFFFLSGHLHPWPMKVLYKGNLLLLWQKLWHIRGTPACSNYMYSGTVLFGTYSLSESACTVSIINLVFSFSFAVLGGREIAAATGSKMKRLSLILMKKYH